MKKIKGSLLALALMLSAGQTVFAQGVDEIPDESYNAAAESYTDESEDIMYDPDVL